MISSELCGLCAGLGKISGMMAERPCLKCGGTGKSLSEIEFIIAKCNSDKSFREQLKLHFKSEIIEELLQEIDKEEKEKVELTDEEANEVKTNAGRRGRRKKSEIS